MDKAPSGEKSAARGDDANKKVRGRKQHIAVDANGRLLLINLTPADVAEWVLTALKSRWPG